MDPERDLPLEQYKPFIKFYTGLSTSDQRHLQDQGYVSIVTEEVDETKVSFIEIAKKSGQLILKQKLQRQKGFGREDTKHITWKSSLQQNTSKSTIEFVSQTECYFILVLIWEKIYNQPFQKTLQIQMPDQNNLNDVLNKLINGREQFLGLLNFEDYFIHLHELYDSLSIKEDKNQKIHQIHLIVRAIFDTIQHRNIEIIFKQSIFTFLLQLQTSINHHQGNKNVNFLKLWYDSLQIKKLIDLNQEVIQKIMLIHKISFYRQNILDLKSQNHLQHALMLVQIQCKQNLIQQLIKGNLIDEISRTDGQIKDIKLLNQTLLQSQLENNNILINKVHFAMQAIILAKNAGETIFKKFIDKIYQSHLMEMIDFAFDKNLVESLDFLICLAKCDSFKFINYLKLKYREQPSNNLHQKLTKKYCSANQQTQASILQIVKYLNQSFIIKQNLDFFLGTFFTYVFLYCSSQKGLILILSELVDMIQNIQPLMLQALKSRVFSKIVMFLRNISRDKITQLKALKIMKRILLQNATQNKEYKQQFLKQINNQIINSGFFDYCLIVLAKNIQFNNILSSSMLQNLKIISQYRHFTPYHQYIQTNSQLLPLHFKFVQDIIKMKPEQISIVGEDNNPISHLKQLQQEKQQQYFLKQIQDQIPIHKSVSQNETNTQIEEFKRYREVMMEIQRQNRQEQAYLFDVSRKKVKENEKIEPSSFSFDLAFDEQM